MSQPLPTNWSPAHLRARLLNSAFALLYRRLVLFHEPAGRFLFGAAWHGRRVACLETVPNDVRIVDLGAGEGRLVGEARQRMIDVVGIEPSTKMRRSALRRGVPLVEGSSWSMPIATGSFDVVLVTYPGGWIFANETWTEIDRIAAQRSKIVILLGGSYCSGPWSRVRGILSRIAYGDRERDFNVKFPGAEVAGFTVDSSVVEDVWGKAIIVTAAR